MTAAPSGDSSVIGGGQHGFGRMPYGGRGVPVAAGIFDRAAEMDRKRPIRLRKFPGVSVRQPPVRMLLLPAVMNPLLEQPVLIANAVAEGGDAECRHAVEVAGGKPPEPAIAKAGIGLAASQIVEIQIERGQRFARLLEKLEIDQRVE